MNKKEFRDDAFETIRDLLSDNESIDEIKKQLENFILYKTKSQRNIKSIFLLN